MTQDLQETRPHILMVTHVIPYPPAAGNEIRIFNMLKWFRRKGYRVTLVLRPLEAIEVPNECVVGLDGIVDDLYLFDSRVRQASPEVADIEVDPDFDNDHLTELQNGFCPSWFVLNVIDLIGKLKPNVLISEYIFMSRVLISSEAFGCLKIIDSHDLFCRKQEAAERYGIKSYGLVMSEQDEVLLLNRAEVILAIQQIEKREIQRLVPKRNALLTAFDVEIEEHFFGDVDEGCVLVVASGNEFNVRGTQDFLDYTWPIVRLLYPKARLRLVGKVCKSVHTNDPSVSLLDFVQNLTDEYARACVVVNPCGVGTGLKIKTIEALAWGKPHVGWSASSDGLRELGELPYVVAGDVVDFANAIVAFLEDAVRRQEYSVRAHEFIREHFGADTVYGPLTEVIETHCAHRQC